MQIAAPLLLLFTVILETSTASLTPNYGNPFTHGGRCGKGQSKLKLKFSGQHHKVCAPTCNPNNGGEDISCPVSTVKAEGTCISVSKRRLCILSCTNDDECPLGASCHSTPSVSLCIYRKSTMGTKTVKPANYASRWSEFHMSTTVRLIT